MFGVDRGAGESVYFVGHGGVVCEVESDADWRVLLWSFHANGVPLFAGRAPMAVFQIRKSAVAFGKAGAALQVRLLSADFRRHWGWLQADNDAQDTSPDAIEIKDECGEDEGMQTLPPPLEKTWGSIYGSDHGADGADDSDDSGSGIV